MSADFGKKNIAEFDLIADDYYNQHKNNIRISGENPEYFSEYKVIDLADYVKNNNVGSADIFDFGCGIGNSVEFFRRHFPESKLSCGDVSKRSIDIARDRFPGDEIYVQIDEKVPFESDAFDIIFTACVFHHIPHEEHERWLVELKRITRSGGILAIYEHNPFNPLTVRAVNNCPIDVNARLVRADTISDLLRKTGWTHVNTEYKIFFPAALKCFRPFEKYLSRIFLGAQWRTIAKK